VLLEHFWRDGILLHGFQSGIPLSKADIKTQVTVRDVNGHLVDSRGENDREAPHEFQENNEGIQWAFLKSLVTFGIPSINE
jgi:hypothetical protein